MVSLTSHNRLKLADDFAVLTYFRYGDDGSWSAVSIKIGQPQQQLDVMVSTASSEITVVASTACETGKQIAYPYGTRFIGVVFRLRSNIPSIEC